MSTPNATWRIAWKDDTISIDGEPQPLVFGSQPVVAEARDIVDTLDEVAGLWAEWDAPGQWALVRFQVHQSLLALLPRMRALRAMEATRGDAPQRYIIEGADGGGAWLQALQCCFPQAELDVRLPRGSSSLNASRIALRAARALATRRRLARLGRKRPGTPRVLLFTRDRLWDGERDTELGRVKDHLESAGAEVVVITHWASLHDRLARAYRTRPKGHLFADEVFLRQQLARKRKVAPYRGIYHPGLLEDDADSAIYTALSGQHHEWARVNTGIADRFARFFRTIDPDIALVPDENGGSHLAKTALMELGIPVVGVQHGCIHRDHMAYTYPEWMTPEDVPLANVTCVYGQHEADLLTAHSIYPPEAIRITGQPQADARATHSIDRPDRSDPTDRAIILFTAQPLYRAYAVATLMHAFTASDREDTLVIRPHPRDEDDAFWDNVAHDAAPKSVRIDRTTSLETLLAQCDVHASMSSTVLSEAVLYGKPNLVVCATEVGDWLNVIAESVGHALSEFPDFDSAVTQALTPTSAYPDARDNYIARHFGALDGRASERIAEVVLEWAKK